MFFLYQITITLIIFLSPIIFIFRIFKKKEDKRRYKEKFSFPSLKRKNGKLIWFHGASVGEIQSVIPLIKYYEKNKSINQILITSSTLSSSKVFEKFNFKKTIHQFYPIDHIYLTNKFLNYWKPDLAIFIDSEIWPCMFYNVDKKRIPLILFNARLTKKTFDRWVKMGKFSKTIFNKIKIAYPQNLETKSYLDKMNVKNIKFIGNIKFSENYEKYDDNIQKKLNLELKKKKVWVASSTHKYEEIFCAQTHIELKKKIKNLITIIIPRHVHRTKRIVSEISRLKLKVLTHSSKIKTLKNVDIYIVDTFGETKKFHKISSSVFLGGSIIKRGGQNPLEAARYGSNIFHGPNIENFRDVYKLLKSLKISKTIRTPHQLALSIKFKKNKYAGNKIKKIGEKILKKTIKEFDFLLNEIKKA